MRRSIVCPAAWAQGSDLPPFLRELLNDPGLIREGKEILGQIQFRHGKAAYPGKAHKLNRSRYTPEFVYDRVTNGFRGMTSFREQFTVRERQAVTVFIMNRDFSN